MGVGSGYSSKPRPMLVIQDDCFANLDSATVIPITSTASDAPLFRIPMPATAASGLRVDSFLMVDKIMTVKKTSATTRVGHAPYEVMVAADRAIATFLGLATPTAKR